MHRIGRTARAGESGAAISFVTAAERAQLKAVERFIRKSIPVDRDHPYHSEAGEQAGGKAKEGLPQAPWVHPANRNRTNRKRNRRVSFLGRRQSDFRQSNPEQ